MAYNERGEWVENSNSWDDGFPAPAIPSYRFLNIIGVIKAIRTKTSLGLKEAKDLAELVEIVGLVPKREFDELVSKACPMEPSVNEGSLRRGVAGSVEILKNNLDSLY